MANPKIQLRHDTAANWTSVNPVLLEGEVGIETDTKKFKVGDGVTAWTSLTYGNADTEAIDQLEQDYGSLVEKVDGLEDNAITLDKINTPLEQQNVYGTRTLTVNEGNSVHLDPVYEAKLSYYKMSGVWNYRQVQVALDFGDNKSGDWLIMRNGKQFRLNCNEGQFNNFIYDGVKIATGGAPDWSFEFTSDYNVLITGEGVDDTLIELPEDIKTYLQSIKDNIISTNVIILTDRVATTNITLQTLEGTNLGLSYDNNTLKVNDSGQLYTDVSNIPLVTTSNGILFNDGSADYTIVGVDEDTTSVDLGISKSGYYVNMLSSAPLQRNHTETIYDTSMNNTLSGLSMPDKTKVTVLAAGQAGTTYTAPANGWFLVDGVDGAALNVNNVIVLRNITTRLGASSFIDGSMPCGYINCVVPVLAGDVVAMYYQGALTTANLTVKFIYAQGEEVS